MVAAMMVYDISIWVFIWTKVPSRVGSGEERKVWR